MNIKVHESIEDEFNKMLNELKKLGFKQNPYYSNEPTFLALSFKLPYGGKVIIEAGGNYLMKDPKPYSEFGTRLLVNQNSRDSSVIIASYDIRTSSSPNWFTEGLAIVKKYIEEANRLVALPIKEGW